MNYSPLHSWDFFLHAFQRQMQLGEDIKQLKLLAAQEKWNLALNIHQVLEKEGRVILVTNPSLEIVFASSNITDMNGYLPGEVIGRKATMFQGPHTSEITRKKIRLAVSKLEPFSVRIVNYRRDKKLYECDIEAFPVYNEKREHVHFIAFEKEFTP